MTLLEVVKQNKVAGAALIISFISVCAYVFNNDFRVQVAGGIIAIISFGFGAERIFKHRRRT